MTELDNNTITEENNTADTQSEQGAAPSGAEDTPRPNPWESVATEQSATIDKLTEHIKSLNSQIAALVQGGAQINDGKQSQTAGANMSQYMDTKPNNSLPDDYVPLKDLGKLIGKKDKK